MASTTPTEIRCVSLGMVIIDDIHMPKQTLHNVLGGSASFVTLGQRLFANRDTEVGCLLIAGDDFPSAVRKEIESWGTTLVCKKRENMHSTRGTLTYEDDTFGPKTFTYNGDPLRASPADLVGTPLLHAKAFHFFGTPDEILHQVPELLEFRADAKVDGRPLIVWEPLPAACTPQNRTSFFEACKLVDIFSPNHIELSRLFESSPADDLDYEKLESFGQAIVDSSIGPTGEGIVIIRAGEHGASSMSSTSRSTWLPAYYEKGSPKVIDPTGAGNTFLGGYIAGWWKTSDIREAMYHGHVAASFALEQIGLPSSKEGIDGVLWNGASAIDRLQEYKDRLSHAKVRSERVL